MAWFIFFWSYCWGFFFASRTEGGLLYFLSTFHDVLRFPRIPWVCWVEVEGLFGLVVSFCIIRTIWWDRSSWPASACVLSFDSNVLILETRFFTLLLYIYILHQRFVNILFGRESKYDGLKRQVTPGGATAARYARCSYLLLLYESICRSTAVSGRFRPGFLSATSDLFRRGCLLVMSPRMKSRISQEPTRVMYDEHR